MNKLKDMIDVLPIIEARRAGLTCREVAQRFEIPEHRVHHIMRATGYAGKFRGKGKNVERLGAVVRPIWTCRLDTMMEYILKIADLVEIEPTADWEEGYICTIDDVTGTAGASPTEAVRSALQLWETAR